MKKKVIALAVASLASGGAFAQSQVTISGAIEAHVEAASATGATAANGNLTSRTRVMDNTSWLRFSGTENLGNGMSAYFQVESDLGIDNAGTGASSTGNLGNRNSGVGLKGAWGDIMLGHWDMQYTSQLQGGVDFGSAGALPHAANSMNITARDNVGVFGGRINNVVKYATPDFNGLSADILWSADTTAGAVEQMTAGLAAKNTAWNLNIRYANGPINAFYGGFRNNNVGSVNGTDQLSDRAGVAYKLPMGLKFGVVYDSSKRETAALGTTNKRTAWSLPISYMTGPHGIYFAYAKAGNDNNVSNTGAKNVVLGYTYSLSKRTQLSATYSKISNDSAATYDFWTRGVGIGAANAGADPQSVAFGINHAF